MTVNGNDLLNGAPSDVPSTVPSVVETVIEGGVPVSTVTPVTETPTPDATQTPQLPVETPNAPESTETPVSTPEDLTAASERLSQRNAKLSKLVTALGEDPNSDMADQLEAGVITAEDVRNRLLSRMNVPQTVAPVAPVSPANDPVTEATTRLETAKAAYNAEAKEGGVQLTTNSEYMDAIQGLNEAKLNAVTQQVTARETATQANENVNAVLSAAQSGEFYGDMSTEMQGEVDLASIGLTGIIADREAQQLGLNPANLNANQVAYFANKAQVILGNMASHFISIGEARVRDGFRPPVNPPGAPPVTPIGPSGNAIPVPNQYLNVSIDSHKDAARAYEQSLRPVV